MAGAARNLDRVRIGFVRPFIELRFPRRLFGLDLGVSLGFVLLEASVFPCRRRTSEIAAALASPQMPTEIGFTKPSILASVSI